jgi:hypothetical protein
MTAISGREVGTTGVKVTILGHLLNSFSLAPIAFLDVQSVGARQQRERQAARRVT